MRVKKESKEEQDDGNKIKIFEYRGKMVLTFEQMPLAIEAFQCKSEMKTKMAHWAERYAEYGQLIINITFDEQE